MMSDWLTVYRMTGKAKRESTEKSSEEQKLKHVEKGLLVPLPTAAIDNDYYLLSCLSTTNYLSRSVIRLIDRVFGSKQITTQMHTFS